MSAASERLDRAFRNEELWTIYAKEIRAVLEERQVLLEALALAEKFTVPEVRRGPVVPEWLAMRLKVLAALEKANAR